MIENFARQLVPVTGLLLMLTATVGSMRPSSVVDLVEFAGQCKLAFRGQSYVFVGYNAVLPVVLLASFFFLPLSLFEDRFSI